MFTWSGSTARRTSRARRWRPTTTAGVVDDDLLQCVLFDGNTKQAKLMGSIDRLEALFEGLREQEKEYWTRTTSRCSSASWSPRVSRRSGEGVHEAVDELVWQDLEPGTPADTTASRETLCL